MEEKMEGVIEQKLPKHSSQRDAPVIVRKANVIGNAESAKMLA